MKILNSIGYWLSFLLPWIGHSGNEYHAALDVLWPRFRSLCISDEPRLAAAEHELDELAQKIKSLKPVQRRAYATWIAYYRYEIKSLRKEARQKAERAAYIKSGKFPNL